MGKIQPKTCEGREQPRINWHHKIVFESLPQLTCVVGQWAGSFEELLLDAPREDLAGMPLHFPDVSRTAPLYARALCSWH